MEGTGILSVSVYWDVVPCDPELDRHGDPRRAGDTGERLRIVVVRTARGYIQFFHEQRLVTREFTSFFHIDLDEYFTLMFSILARILLEFRRYLLVQSVAWLWRQQSETGR